MDPTLSEDALHEELLSGDPTKQVCSFFFAVDAFTNFNKHLLTHTCVHTHTQTQVEAIQKIIRLADEGTPVNVNWPVFLAVCIRVSLSFFAFCPFA